MTDTIFFDVGNTLRIVIPDKEFSDAAERELMELVGATEPHDVFFEKLEANWKAYRKLAKGRLLDVSEMELWLRYLLPDYPADRVAPNAARLTRLWRDHDGRRLAHEGVDVGVDLFADVILRTTVADNGREVFRNFGGECFRWRSISILA